jgi:hypothetical protein
LYVRMDSSELGMTYDYELSLWYVYIILWIFVFSLWVCDLSFTMVFCLVKLN